MNTRYTLKSSGRRLEIRRWRHDVTGWICWQQWTVFL